MRCVWDPRPWQRTRNPAQPSARTRDATPAAWSTGGGARRPQRGGEVAWLFPFTGNTLSAFPNPLDPKPPVPEFPGSRAWSGDTAESDQAPFLFITQDPDLLISNLAASADSRYFLHLEEDLNPGPTRCGLELVTRPL